ncbi:MAG: zinc ribbon domain-containing protein [Acidobacteriota bacterium]|nr:zinc ribbon domain-containing protein [Acidobacteriota bacterium]
MPLYEYRCEACGAKEEKLQGFSAPTAHDCPECGHVKAMHRQISRAAFVLSGSGWYASGYSEKGKAPSEAPKGAAGAAAAKGGGSAAAAGSGGDTAAEAPAESKTACASGCACHSPKPL